MKLAETHHLPNAGINWRGFHYTATFTTICCISFFFFNLRCPSGTQPKDKMFVEGRALYKNTKKTLGRWLDGHLSITFKAGQSQFVCFLLPVEPLGNSTRLPISARDDTWPTSPSGSTAVFTEFLLTLVRSREKPLARLQAWTTFLFLSQLNPPVLLKAIQIGTIQGGCASHIH